MRSMLEYQDIHRDIIENYNNLISSTTDLIGFSSLLLVLLTDNVLGNVVINKKGCITSNISARGNIIVNNNDGFLRGGKYSAGEII